MTTIPQLADTMFDVLNTTTNIIARQTGFVQRTSKLTGAAFVQSLVFGWQSNPHATLGNLAQTASCIGVSITPQGLDQRFSESAARLLQGVLEAVVNTVMVTSTQPSSVPLFNRFNGVYVVDSTIIGLPDPLQPIWQGCGGDGNKAALKLQVRLDLCGGEEGDDRTIFRERTHP